MTLAVASLMITSVYARDISIDIDDMIVPTLVAPVQEAGTTLVPLRIIGEELGATLGWDGPSQTVTITKANTQIKLMINRKTVFITKESTFYKK